MAEVLSPPMQPSSSMTMLHTRPASADAFQATQQYHQSSRLNQAPRSMYNVYNHTYRTASAPVQPYAFQSTPNLRQENRTISTPHLSNGQGTGHRPTASESTTSSDSSLQPAAAKDDTSTAPRIASMIDFSPTLPELNFSSFETPVKASPDRYRRPPPKRVESNSNNNNTIVRTPSPAVSEASLGDVSNAVQARQVQRQSSYDDIGASKSSPAELAKRYRRRSLNQLDTFSSANTPPPQALAGTSPTPGSAQDSNGTSTPTTIRPVALIDGDGESHQATGGAVRERERVYETAKPKGTTPSRTEQKVNVPLRGASDGSKRLAAPSPLSRQASDVDSPPNSTSVSPAKPKTYAAALQSPIPALSPAAQQLAAVSDKDLNKGMKSRLRRAFSFGSAQELRRVAGENSQQQTTQQNKEQHQQQIDDELDAEQLEIARRQEAAGIGAGIYSGQGGFTGSTDNLSISSTASSASMMLRKMGRGAKKSARSIKGLFRPKSVIGVPAADGPVQVSAAAPVEPSVGQVSMITVEAERQNVNVNAHPDERTGGGTAFPKLERNSLDAGMATVVPENRVSADTSSDSHSRRSVVGSDKDRAEVLAAVRKGILKRSGTSSPSGSPTVKASDYGLPQVPHITESPTSSMPSTPREGPPNRSASAPAVNDYFSARMAMGRSMPNTPNGSIRSISFSPRIQFHDAWSSSEYDRRGEIATCNRLTPLLAQQIKEELNTFKMEMEVHEQSKPHTHFF